jgi:hypothetical protein
MRKTLIAALLGACLLIQAPAWAGDWAWPKGAQAAERVSQGSSVKGCRYTNT